jgi:hypothetical protein
MTISSDDRQAITDLLNQHGHYTDRGALDRMDDLFAADAVLDLTDFGLGVRTGLGPMAEATRAVGDGHPVGHHVTNIVLSEGDAGTVVAISKGIGIMADGSCGSVVYDDVLRRYEAGWRIARRTIRARRAPLTP